MTYCTRHWSRLLLGYTLHGRVVDGHIQPYLHGLVVQRSRTVLQPSQAFHDILRNVWVSNSVRDYSDGDVQDMTLYKCTEEAGSR